MEATAFSIKGNHAAQPADTTDSITTTNSEGNLARAKFAEEIDQLRNGACPGLKHDRPKDATLVASGTVTVPDEPGVTCKGGFIEIKPFWNSVDSKPALPTDVHGGQTKPGKPLEPGRGDAGNGNAICPENRLPPDWKPAEAKPLPQSEGGRPGADDHRRPHRPFPLEGMGAFTKPNPQPGKEDERQ